MDNIKRFIDCYIPTETCNLRCHYCYIAQKRRFNAKLASFTHTPAEIRQALSKKRFGGPCLINMCAGGETLLSPDVLPVVRELLTEGHYISLVTNGTVSQRFDEIIQWPAELRHRLFMKMSFHYLELKRLNWMERYFANIQKLKDAQVSFTVEITPSDELVPYIEDVKDICLHYLGALCHITIARDDRTKGIDVLSDYPFDEYKKIWGQFHSTLFDFKTNIFYQKRKEFCYAGEWSVYLNLETGRLTQCYGCKELDNIYSAMDKPLKFEAVGYGCPIAHCYNGHAFLALGDIPGLEAPTYAEERNRVCADGSEWLQPEMKAFLSTRLYDSNSEYSMAQKAKYRLRKTKVFGMLKKVKRYVHK